MAIIDPETPEVCTSPDEVLAVVTSALENVERVLSTDMETVSHVDTDALLPIVRDLLAKTNILAQVAENLSFEGIIGTLEDKARGGEIGRVIIANRGNFTKPPQKESVAEVFDAMSYKIMLFLAIKAMENSTASVTAAEIATGINANINAQNTAIGIGNLIGKLEAKQRRNNKFLRRIRIVTESVPGRGNVNSYRIYLV